MFETVLGMLPTNQMYCHHMYFFNFLSYGFGPAQVCINMIHLKLGCFSPVPGGLQSCGFSLQP
uniref:Uncharacterized protein n=1 Tax=Anguilla anguilla TaxID=7936 RepID=A0A0E9UDY0_ANGAN